MLILSKKYEILQGYQEGVNWKPCFKTDCRGVYIYVLCMYFYKQEKPKNWVEVTMVNVRAVKHTVRLKENVVQNYIEIG